MVVCSGWQVSFGLTGGPVFLWLLGSPIWLITSTSLSGLLSVGGAAGCHSGVAECLKFLLSLRVEFLMEAIGLRVQFFHELLVKEFILFYFI